MPGRRSYGCGARIPSANCRRRAFSKRQAAGTSMSTAARRRLAHPVPDCELARHLRKPVAENLLNRKSAVLEPRPNRLGRLAVVFEIVGGEFCGSGALSLQHDIDFPPKTRAGFHQIFDLYSRIADGCAPPGTWVDGWGCFEFEEMPEDPPDLRIELGPLRGSQAVYLLREVFPVEWQIRTPGPAQRRGLLFGPEQKILIVKLIGLRHPSPPSRDMMGLERCSFNPSVSPRKD